MLYGIAEGFTLVEVGGHLGISHRTVEGHEQWLRARLAARNLPHLVKIAGRLGLLEDPELTQWWVDRLNQPRGTRPPPPPE